MAAYQLLLLNTAVPQIQAAQAGDTYVCPRDIQITANLDVTGNTILGDASTDTVRVNGYMGVGGAASSAIGLRVINENLVGSTSTGVLSNITGTSSSTSIRSFTSAPKTAASVHTVSTLFGFLASDATLGAGSTITNQHGVYIADQTQGTNNYGITSLVSSGTDKWNIYASGTAANYFAGQVGIGGTTLINTAHLTISGSGTGSVTGGGILSLFRPSTTAVSGTNFGSIYFTGADTTSNTPTTLAYIRGQASGTHDPGDNPTDLVFAVTADGTEAVYEAMRLNQAGGIVTQPIAGGHTVFNENGVDADFRVESDTNTHALFVQGSDGNVGIGTSSPVYTLQVDSGASDATALFNSTNANGSHIRLSSSGTVKNYIGNAAGFITSGSADDLGLRAVGKISFATNGAAADMILDTSGNLISTAPTTPPTLTTNGTMVFNLTSNTNLRISVRGSDGVTRTADITLA